MAFKQVRNDELLDAIRADVQFRYEPNFAWKSAVSALMALPALRACWPMSSVDYAAATQGRDVSGGAYHLTNNNSADFGYDNLAPCVTLDGTQDLSRIDGGVANWADIRGNEAYVLAAQRGFTIGGWVYCNAVAATEYFASKWDATGNQRGWTLSHNAAGAGTFEISSTGLGVTSTVSSANATITATAWKFIVGRFLPSASVDVFVNGTWWTAASGDATIVDNTAPFRAGATTAAGAAALQLTGKESMLFMCAAAVSDAIIGCFFQQTKAMFGV